MKELPALTLVFSVDLAEFPCEPQRHDTDICCCEPASLLLDLADSAIDAIEAAAPRFHILKAFTFEAGD